MTREAAEPINRQRSTQRPERRVLGCPAVALQDKSQRMNLEANKIEKLYRNSGETMLIRIRVGFEVVEEVLFGDNTREKSAA
jgi:hypothetical protein